MVEHPGGNVWDQMLDEFRSLGGIAENICLKEGRYGRGLFPVDPSKPYKINIPPSLLVDVKHVRFVDNVFRVAPEAHTGAREKAFLENYQRDFAWGVRLEEHTSELQSHP